MIKSTFNVTELFKGNAQKIEHVTSSDSSASCGISYVVGESYVVLTGADKKVSICRGYDHYFPASSKDINDTRSLGILKALRLKQ